MNRWRHYTLVCAFMVMMVGLIGRVVYLSTSEHKFLQAQGDARSIRNEVIPSYRGVVYDRSGQALAVSTPVIAVWADPKTVTLDTDQTRNLALALGRSVPDVTKSLGQSNRFVYLKRGLTVEEGKRVGDLHLPGIYQQPEYRRYYPASETASHVVGVTSVDDVGLEGIELSFNTVLKGQRGEKVVLRDRLGNTIADLEYKQAPQIGRDLVLSLDLRLQFFAYRELKAAVQGHQAVSGSLVMVDVLTGEILALVNQPSYNPNENVSGGFKGMRNRAVTDTYEPGSTIKPFAVLAALESGKFNAQSTIDTSPGYFRVGNKLIGDPSNLGVVSLTQILQKSSQVGIAKIALELEEKSIYDVLVRAGIGEFIGTGLPGEAMGTLSDNGLRSPIMRATLAYGYGLTASPLHLAQAYLSLATDGVRVPLSILKQKSPPQGERVFDAGLVKEVVHMMESVTQGQGTAVKAQLSGYRIAGKTGTSRIVGTTGYDDQRHVAIFAGIAPASAPRIVMVVVVNEPKGERVGGGTVAAPVFARVAARALRLLGVDQDRDPGAA
ncbi:MAG: penicillin-binding transpeptidase domain-containing protein [Proteobacteria bacterium]|nr:penicillin-binding transpeptidase domain-containing protein [Pseudomonadota bacterium]